MGSTGGIIHREKNEKELQRLLQMLMLHCEEGNYTQVKQLLDDKPLEFDVDFALANNESGFTPLAMAVKHHHIEIAEYLIQRGANVDSVNKTRQSVLFNASYDNYIDGARLLLDHNANVDY